MSALGQTRKQAEYNGFRILPLGLCTVVIVAHVKVLAGGLPAGSEKYHADSQYK